MSLNQRNVQRLSYSAFAFTAAYLQFLAFDIVIILNCRTLRAALQADIGIALVVRDNN